MEMGTGKSRTIIEIAKLRADKFGHLVWLCPVSLKSTVLFEILKHTNLTDNDVYVFNQKTDDENIPLDKCFYVVGLESIGMSNRATFALNKILKQDTFVVVDESTYIKGHNSTRTKRITAMASRCKYRTIMTGTPFTQNVSDLFSQMKFLSSKILGYNSFYSFVNNHLEYKTVKIGQGKRAREVSTHQVKLIHNQDIIAEKIAPYTYQVKKDECLDLPSKLYEYRTFDMSDEQKASYEDAKYQCLISFDKNKPFNICVLNLFSELQAIVCGHHWGTPIFNERIKTMMEAISDIPENEKIIIWSKYIFNINEIVEALGEENVARYDGTKNEKERDIELKRWRESGARFLCATPASGGHGLTLNEAKYVIFFSNGYKYSERVQAEDRNHRIGQMHHVTYIDIVCSKSIDSHISISLSRKEDALRKFQGEFEKIKDNMDLVKEHIKNL
jgi:SNF2 family DNA or RNA helicase